MIKLIKEVKLFNAGYVQMWDFSEANASEANRIEAVTTVANVCRGDKGVKNPKELYQQLLTEHDGKPGSVFEFVPILYNAFIPYDIENPCIQYGTPSRDIGRGQIFHTNLRALIASNESSCYYQDKQSSDGFFVFKIKVPQMIVKHILRHRMLSFQEMSERTNKLREYYHCDEFEQLHMSAKWNWFCQETSQSRWDEIQHHFGIRQELLNKGSHGLAYTILWIAGWKQDKSGWDNFFAVRTKKPAQREVIELAEVIKKMMEKK